MEIDKIKRKEDIDVLKGIAVCLMVMGHCIQYGAFQTEYFEEPLFKFIYSFHMPLFMLISGFLFGVSIQKYKLWDLISRKIRTLLYPASIWAIVIYIVVGIQYGMSVFDIDFISFFKTITSFWFLWAVFFSVLVVSITHKISKNKYFEIAILFLVGIISLFLPNGYNMELYVFMYPFFVIGYLWNNYSLSISQKYTILILLGLLPIFCILYYKFNSYFYVYVSGTCIVPQQVNLPIDVYQLFIDIYRFVFGVIGCIIVITFNKLIISQFKFIPKVLSNIGKLSLLFYLMNAVLIHILIRIIANDYHGYNVLMLETIISTVVMYYVAKVIKKNATVKKLLLGV